MFEITYPQNLSIKFFNFEVINTFLFSIPFKFYVTARVSLRKLKQLEKINGRLAMGGLIYLVFTKLVSNRADILDQLKSYLI